MLEDSEIDILQNKLLRYENIISQLVRNVESNNVDLVENSENDKIITTQSGNQFKVIDETKDLGELNMKEYNVLKRQDDLIQYNKVTKYCSKAGITWGWTSTVVGIGKVFMGFL